MTINVCQNSGVSLDGSRYYLRGEAGVAPELVVGAHKLAAFLGAFIHLYRRVSSAFGHRASIRRSPAEGRGHYRNRSSFEGGLEGPIKGQGSVIGVVWANAALAFSGLRMVSYCDRSLASLFRRVSKGLKGD
jgi:hypothetical protein